MTRLVAGVVRPLEQLLEVYRSGGGVPFGDYGTDMREGQAAINRPAFLQQLGYEWLPSIPDIHARLLAHPPARIADIGSGYGWSSIGMAQAYPGVQVDGFDLDRPSIEMARQNAREAGLEDRVRFYARDAGSLADGNGQYDLVTAFEAVHDMSNPVAVLRTMRRLAGSTGAVIVVDERVGDTFTETGNDVEWMMYGWSIFHCLPAGMAEEPSAATGTVMRTDTLRQYALEAGFRDIEILPIDNYFFRFYRLLP
jgi:2-polyprenyl-3-methyl-5-hydroxy-6-metoxy-1,4-benzoquinol methylase